MSYCSLNPSPGWTASTLSSFFPAQCSDHFLITLLPSEAVSREPISVRLSLIISVTFSSCTYFEPVRVQVNEIQTYVRVCDPQAINVTTCITIWMKTFQYLHYLHINYITVFRESFFHYWPMCVSSYIRCLHIYAHRHVDVRTLFSLRFVNHEATYFLLFHWQYACLLHYACVLHKFVPMQLVEALRYKPEGREFDSRWCYWSFSLTESWCRPSF